MKTNVTRKSTFGFIAGVISVLMVFSEFSFAGMSGTFSYHIDDQPVWDIAGSYSSLQSIQGEDGGVLTFSELFLTVDSTGKIAGTCTATDTGLYGAKPFSASVKGSVKSSGALCAVKLDLAGLKTSTKGKLRYQGNISPDGSLSGCLAGQIDGQNRSVSSYAIPLFTDCGDWSILLENIATDSKNKVTGTANITLSNGRSAPFGLTGKYNPKTKTTLIRLKGYKEGTIAGSLSFVFDNGSSQISNLKGKLLGVSVAISEAQTNSFIVALPATLPASGQISLPSGCALPVSQLVVRSIAGSAAVDSGGNFSALNVIDGNNAQNLMIEKTNGTLIATALVLPSDLGGGPVTIGPEQMALGLINMNPYVTILDSDKQLELLDAVRSHADYSSLIEDISNALINAPEQMLDYEAYPYIFNKAVRIGVETLSALGNAQSLSAAYENPGISSIGIASAAASAIIGDEDNPHLKDVAGDDIILVNPTMVFYGVQANNMHNVIRGREKAFSLVPWDFGWTDPIEKRWSLGDGTFRVTYYKGFNVGTNGWLSYTHAAGKATYANFARCVFIVLDIAGMDNFSLSNSQIEALLLLDNIPSIDFSALAPESGSDFSWQRTISRIQDFVAEHWDEFAYWVWQESSGWTSNTDQVTRYLRQSKQVVDGILSALGPVGAILDIANGEMFNEWIPFFVDLARKPSIIQYDILQSNGMISVVNSYIPPTASFTVDRKSISVGQTVAFDASSSYDDMDSLSQLQCRWDYDGNGSWDTSWSTSKATSHCYNSRGTFYAVLEVKDTLGLTSIVTKSIHVGSQDAFKIVLTWGANPRDLDSHLWTPSIYGTTYHVYYSTKGSASSAPYVWLDLDDTTSYGPETVWFEQFFPGTYVYSVYLYAGEGTLNTSGAHVEVINTNGVVRSFNVPTTGSGRWWNVFSMNGTTRVITPINTLSSSAYSASASFSPMFREDAVHSLNADIYMPVKISEE